MQLLLFFFSYFFVRIEVDMENFMRVQKHQFIAMFSAVILAVQYSQRSSTCKEYIQIIVERTSWSTQEESTCFTVYFTLISLNRQCNFRVVGQRKSLPFSNELSINESSICTVIFNIGNIGIFWTHFL